MRPSVLVPLLLLASAGCGAQSEDLFLRVTDAGLAPVCISASDGDSSTCEGSMTWIERARDRCAAEGLALLDWSPSEPCESGAGYRRTKFTCCPPVLAGCSWHEEYKEKCMPSATWTQYAEGQCDSEGRVVFEATLTDVCGPDSFGTSRYYCCP